MIICVDGYCEKTKNMRGNPDPKVVFDTRDVLFASSYGESRCIVNLKHNANDEPVWLLLYVSSSEFAKMWNGDEK